MEDRASSEQQQQQHPPDLLPESVLVSILQHVPLTQRLTCCALVCRAWATAVALSSKAVELKDPDETTFNSFQAWLQRYGGEVISMRVDTKSSNQSVLQLPSKLTALQSLILSSAKPVFQMPTGGVSTRSRSQTAGSQSCAPSFGSSSSGAPHNAAAATTCTGLLPRLQHLELKWCSLPVKSFQQLSQLASLTSLLVRWPQLRHNQHSADLVRTERSAKAVSGLLQHLPSLLVLQLNECDLTAPHLAHFTVMQHLQQLELHCDWSAPSDNLAALPTTLTALSLISTCYDYGDFSLRTVPQLSQMTKLQALKLHSVRLNPTALHCCPQLQRLDLWEFTVAALDAGGPATDFVCWQALLGAVGRLTQLQHIELNRPFEMGEATHPSWFTALTASSHLTALEINASGFMPAQAMQHMLPPGKQLPHLWQLQLDECFTDNTSRLDAADISSLATGCPALQHLELCDVVSSAGAIRSLTQLRQSLTCLRLEGHVCNEPAAVAVVVQLTSLKSLTWGSLYRYELPLSGVQQLTALQCLTRLELYGWTVCEDGCLDRNPFGFPVVLTDTSEDDQHPDVYQQLQRLCANPTPSSL